MLNVNTSKATGNDGVPARIHKTVASVLAGPRTHTYNMSIQSRVFPLNIPFKHYYVILLRKSSEQSIEKLRPISSCRSHPTCLSNSLFTRTFTVFLQSIGESQLGSRPESSTTCVLIKLVGFVITMLDKPQVDGVQLLAYDFSKAYDVVGHSAIINRLR